MLRHTIILPTDKKHYFPMDILWDLNNDINIKVIFSNIFTLSRTNESHIDKYGKEIIEKNQGFNFKKKSEIPISLYQLNLIDFKSLDSIHLVGDEKQLQFLVQLLKILKLEISVLFSCTQDEKSLQTNEILTYEDIFTINSQDFKTSFFTYCEFLKQNLTKKKQNLELSYSFKIDSCIIPANKSQMALFVEDRKILQTIFKLPQNNKKIFVKKINKFRKKPHLFFKDMLKKYYKKIKNKLKV